jgi:hypothetical protein
MVIPPEENDNPCTLCPCPASNGAKICLQEESEDEMVPASFSLHKSGLCVIRKKVSFLSPWGRG